MACFSSLLSVFTVYLDRNDEPRLTVALEVESCVLGGPEGGPLKNQETRQGSPVSLSKSVFLPSSPFCTFSPHFVGEVWTRARNCGWFFFGDELFFSHPSRSQGQKKPTVDLLLAVLAT